MVQPMQRQWESADPFLAAGAEIETCPSNLPWLAKLFLPADRVNIRRDAACPRFPKTCRRLSPVSIHPPVSTLAINNAAISVHKILSDKSQPLRAAADYVQWSASIGIKMLAY